jgi:tetratricopeptide (TPR) repeat protein
VPNRIASEWFYQAVGKQVGPISGAELRNLAQRGTISRGTLVKNTPDGIWLPAERVNGLFVVSNKTPPPMPVGATAQPISRSNVVADEPSGLNTATKVVMGVCGAVCMIVLGFFVWFVAIRDTWESDHGSDVIRLSKDTVELIQAKDPTNAVKKYEELIVLVGNRKLVAPALTKAVSDARDAGELAKRTIREEQFLSNIRGLEAQAKAFVDAGDFERGIEKYQEALGSIKNAHFDTAELAASAGRISQAKTRVSEKLEQKRNEEERAAMLRRQAAEFKEAPQAARDALKAIKQLQARTEVGLTYTQYMDAVGKAWVEVKPFVDSPDGRKFSEVSSLLTSIITQYKAGMEAWETQIRSEDADLAAMNHTSLLLYWHEAVIRITEAESLLDVKPYRARNPRTVAIEREIDAVQAKSRELSDERTRLSNEWNKCKRELDGYRPGSEPGFLDTLERRVSQITKRLLEIHPEISKNIRKVGKLYDERSVILGK